jgi:hypothetical protein
LFLPIGIELHIKKCNYLGRAGALGITFNLK